jgi:integrase
MYAKHGAYYLVRQNKWIRLGKSLSEALTEYARLTAAPEAGELEKLVADVLTDIKPDIAANTYKVYVGCARRVLEAFIEFRPDQVRPFHIARFLDDSRETPDLANKLLSFLRNVFRRAVRWGVVETDPTRDIGRFKTHKRDRYIDADESRRIQQYATPELCCLIDMGYLTGQRIGDLLKLKLSDISDEGIYFAQQKGGTKLRVAMTPDLAEVIARAKALHTSIKGFTLFHRRDGSPMIYNTINAQWLRACRQAGIENAHFHDIRAAAATDAKAQGLDSKALLGHKTDSSHNRYLRSREVPIATPNKARILRQS